MRRIAPLIAVGLGAFLFVGALVVKLYVYPAVAVAPIDQDSRSILVGPGATIFDQRPEALKTIQTDLTTQALTRGDVAASEAAGDNVRVWVNVTETTSSDGVSRSTEIERAAFDAVTGEAINCCDEYYETEENKPQYIEHKGLLFKFPFRTEKKQYMWWDSTLLDAVPVEYVGTEELGGLKVYRFESDIPRQVVAEREVPASVLELDTVTGNVNAEEMYQNHRTFWVEPTTGVVIKRLEDTKGTIAYEGEDRLTTSDVVTQYDAATVQGNIDEYGPKARLLNLAYLTGPLVMGVLGAVLLVLGGWLYRRNPSS